VLLDADEVFTTAHCMDRLIRQYRLIVVCEQELTQFTVRCYPQINARAKGLPFFASAYSGALLDACLIAAVSEYDRVQSGDCHYELTNSETIRWVA
jgi:hypothetical protein